MPPLPPVDAIAATYNTPGYADPMDAVADFEQYRREWGSSELGSSAVATRMELPRGRIRSWQDGAKPDVVRGIETAREHGWLECAVDSETFRALNRLVAAVYSGGSISADTFVPAFSAPDDLVESQLQDDLETIGAGYQVALSNSGNVEELRPATSRSVLGRVLVALGAPAGEKTTLDRLPAYLYGDSSTSDIRSDFVRVYVANRAVSRENRDFLQIREERSDRYLDSVAALIRDVTDVEVWRGEKTIRFRDSALAILELE